MRLIEQCACGAQIEMVYAVDTLGSSRTEREAERSEGRKQVDTFRRAHKPCLKRLGDPPAHDRIRDEAERLAHIVLAFDAAPMADKPTYRGELIEAARNVTNAVTEAVAAGA